MVQIRFGTVDDYPLLQEIDSTITNDRWNGWVNNKQVILVFRNGKFGGWLQYSLFMEKVPFVNRLYVPEDMQGDSLGTGLMKFWEFEMVELGYDRLMLSTEKGDTAIDFYTGMGYKVLGEMDYFTEHTELILGKEVPPMSSPCCCS